VIDGPKTRLETSSAATAPSEGVSKWQGNVTLEDASRAHGSPRARHQRKASIPVGEACREDGTLKDASEITWLNSPSDENRPLESNEKRSPNSSSELEWPDSPSEAANVRSKRKRGHDEPALNSEDDQPYRAKVSE
jgi:hypothetical protein